MKALKIKKRLFSILLALVTAVGIFAPMTVAHADTNAYSGGGWAMTGNSVTVYKYSNLTTPKGTLYANEGFTILEDVTYDIVHIQYSGSGGAKDGYISLAAAGAMVCTNWTCVAKVNSNTPVYYCNKTSDFKQSGTVYTNELVAVIGKVGNWSLIEYDTSSAKRKRGYVANSSLTYYGEPSTYLQFFSNGNYSTSTKSGTIYSGPSNQYTQVGTISNQSVRVYQNSYTNYSTGVFVSYIKSGDTKRTAGYLIN